MYFLKKTLTISAAHFLVTDYVTPCNNVHGHNWKITIYCKSLQLDQNGMIIDFSFIKNIVNELDHNNVNLIIEQPTAEKIAEYLCNKIPYCYQIDVEETEGNIATFTKEI